MAGSRTLKLSILGDVDNLNKSLKAATADVETFGDKVSKAGKVVGAALVAAAAAAGRAGRRTADLTKLRERHECPSTMA